MEHDNSQYEFDHVKEIPKMPPVMEQIFQSTKAPNSSEGIKLMSEAICADSKLQETVLRIVNSRYFNMGKFQTVQKAILGAGSMEIKNVVMSVVLKELFTPKGVQDLWVHSIRCAIGCRMLAQERQILNPNDAFLIGFLHDIGKTVLYLGNFKEYMQLQQAELFGSRDIIEIENETFATNHCITGVRILRKWHMPPMLIDCIRYHHTPIMSSLPVICGMLYICDKLSQNEAYKLDLEETVLTRLGIALPNEKYLREQIMAKSEIYIESAA